MKSTCTSRCSTRSFSNTSAGRQFENSEFTSSPSSSTPSRSSSSSYRSSLPSQHLYSSPPSAQKTFLDGLLSPVSPLPNAQLIDTLLAERCLTHKSGVDKRSVRGRTGFGGAEEAEEGGKNGHNEKMSFVGKSPSRAKSRGTSCEEGSESNSIP